MTLSQTLLNLIERAERKGSAVKRVREGAVMDSGSWGMSPLERNEYIRSTPMINQWEVKVYTLAYETIEVYHYDTLIFKAENYMPNGYRLLEWYGESNSDRDALNGLCYHYGINKRFTYRPSVNSFEEVMN